MTAIRGEWMVMADGNGRNAVIAIVCHINPDLSIWNGDFKPREWRQADGLFDLGSWKWPVETAAVSGKRDRCGHEPEESDRPYLVDDGTILALQQGRPCGANRVRPRQHLGKSLHTNTHPLEREHK